MNFKMRLKLATMGFLIKKEFKQFFRDKFMPKLLIGFPVMAILVIPWVANMQIKQVKINIIDWDKSSITRDLSNKIERSRYFVSANKHTSVKMTDFTKQAFSFENNETKISHSKQDSSDFQMNLKHCIFTNECDIIMELPSNFEREFIARNFAHISIYANAIESTKGTLASGYLTNIITDFSTSKMAQKSMQTSQNTPQLLTQNHIELLPLYAFNPHLDYKLYMIPALMVMVLTMLCGFLPAFNIITEKQSGSIEQINVTPLPKAIFIISKIIPYWIMGLFVISVCFLLTFIVYGFSSKGGYISIYVIAIAYILVVTGLGLVISNHSNTMQQAMFVAYFFILILLLLSGLFTSVKSMPFWAEILTFFNPLRYFIDALRAIFLKGENLANSFWLWWQLIALLAFAFVFNLWAIMAYKKRV